MRDERNEGTRDQCNKIYFAYNKTFMQSKRSKRILNTSFPYSLIDVTVTLSRKYLVSFEINEEHVAKAVSRNFF